MPKGPVAESAGGPPTTGSAFSAHELQCPDLRAWSLKRHPNIVLYVERPESVDVWRVLHSERDIPAWLREPGAE